MNDPDQKMRRHPAMVAHEAKGVSNTAPNQR